MTLIAVLGSRSSHGGTVITSSSKTLADGTLVARLGDLHTCPIPGHGVTPIVTGSNTVICEGAPVARLGDTTGCGATIITGSDDVIVDAFQ